MTGIDPTTCKPGDVFRIRVGDRVFVGERVDPEDYLQWRLNRPASVWVRDVDVTVLHRLVPEAEEETLDAPMQPWETLRRLADDHQQFCSEYLRMPYEAAETVRTVSPGDIRKEADRLEAEHRAAQEKAAQDAAREALIEKAARIQCDGFYGPGAFDDRAPDDEVRKRYIDDCARLADAGLLAEPGEA